MIDLCVKTVQGWDVLQSTSAGLQSALICPGRVCVHMCRGPVVRCVAAGQPLWVRAGLAKQVVCGGEMHGGCVRLACLQ